MLPLLYCLPAVRMRGLIRTRHRPENLTQENLRAIVQDYQFYPADCAVTLCTLQSGKENNQIHKLSGCKLAGSFELPACNRY